jgi:hypothetical protein
MYVELAVIGMIESISLISARPGERGSLRSRDHGDLAPGAVDYPASV